jgi:hypothetical protein
LAQGAEGLKQFVADLKATMPPEPAGKLTSEPVPRCTASGVLPDSRVGVRPGMECIEQSLAALLPMYSTLVSGSALDVDLNGIEFLDRRSASAAIGATHPTRPERHAAKRPTNQPTRGPPNKRGLRSTK